MAPILYMTSLCKRYQITLVNILFIPHNHIEYNYFIIVIRIPKYRNSSQMKPAMRSNWLFNYLLETGLNDNYLLFII